MILHKNKYEFEFGGDFLKKNKNKDKGKVSPRQSVGLDMGSAPLIEMLGNRRITLEGSTGILLGIFADVLFQRYEKRKQEGQKPIG